MVIKQPERAQAEKEAGKLQRYRIERVVHCFCATLEEDESEKYAMHGKELLGSILIRITVASLLQIMD